MKATLVAVPRSTSKPESAEGVPASSEFNKITASPMLTSFEFTVVVVPLTVKSPAITTVPVLSPRPAGSIVIVEPPSIREVVTLANVTFELVSTACPIDTTPEATATPVPAASSWFTKI